MINDRFISPNHFIYMSKNRRCLNSPDVRAMRNHVALKMRMSFFLRKSDDEGKDYYYLGELTAIKDKFHINGR